MPILALTTGDTIVFAAVALMAIRGAWKGFAWQAIRTVGLVGAVWGATAWHRGLGARLADTFSFVPDLMAPWIAWAFLVVVLFLVAAYVAWIARGAMRRVRLGKADRVLGFFMGAVLGLVLATVGFLVWGSVVTDASLQSALRGGVTTPWTGKVVDALRSVLPPDLRARWAGVLDALPRASVTVSEPGG